MRDGMPTSTRVALAVVSALALGLGGCSGSIGDMEGASGGAGGDASTTVGKHHHPNNNNGGSNEGGSDTSSDGGAGGAGTGGAMASSSTGAGAGGAAGGPSSGRLTAHPKGSTSAPQGFYEYDPPGYGNGQKVPLLVALHGIGENGDGITQIDNVIHVGVGLLLSTDQWPEDRPFLVLLPEHSVDGGCPGGAEIQSFIDWSIKNYDVDPKRVYLTGLSCGGIGAWAYLDVALDSQIAAMVPIAGDGQGAWAHRKCDLGKVPIWAFHGDADPTVNIAGTNVPMDGLATCPSPPRKDAIKTIYPGVGHDSWDQTYNLMSGNDIYTWMLKQSKK
jgi:poly(3-hydroxybutyrate) depolymerase